MARASPALTLLYETNYPALIGAERCSGRASGKGVTIAVLDTGLWQDTTQNYGSRILASIDVANGGSRPRDGRPVRPRHAHHLDCRRAARRTLPAATSASRRKRTSWSCAPSTATAAGRYADVIAGMNWIVANRAKYNIRVLNLSFGAQPQSYYWDDPLNQAVMAAWRAGIVVVASAGNDGPDPMTIDVPGNVPYVITVGALTDNNTPYNAQRRPPRVVLLDRPDVRRLREAGGRRAGRPHRRVDVEQQLPCEHRSGLDAAAAADVHDVGHVAGRGGDHGRGRADAAG